MSHFPFKFFLIFCILLVASQSGLSTFSKNDVKEIADKALLYEKLQLASAGLQEKIFMKALSGYLLLYNSKLIARPEILSIADLSQSSKNKRLYIINVDEQKLLFNTYVAHGRNSGEEFATVFGNEPQSFRSSLGFYLTGEVYNGKHGLSLRLKGCEKGINDKAECRGIVMHGARYVSPSFIEKHGRLGRSQGCPAIPEELSEPIINTIRSGSCFFVFYPDADYLHNSDIGCE